MFGREVYEAGGTYTLTLSPENVQPEPPRAVAPPPIGYFVVNNATGALLTVRVGGTTHKVASGSSSTLQLPVGSYTAEVSARCGRKEDTFDITAGSTYTGQYSCVLPNLGCLKMPFRGHF